MTDDELRRVSLDNDWEVMQASELQELRTENEKLREALRLITEECGPPKMSENVNTAFHRIKRIDELARKALGEE